MNDFKVGDLVKLTGRDWFKYELADKVVEVIGRDSLGPRIADKHDDGVHYRIFQDKERDYSAELVEPLVGPKTGRGYYGGTEVLDFINSQGLGFNLGNTIKYVSRAGKKDPNTRIEDLSKAMDYIRFEIERLEGKR